MTMEDEEWSDIEDDYKEQGMTTKLNSRSCEYEGCSNEAVFECGGFFCDGSGWVCSMHWKDIDTNYLATGMGCERCCEEVGSGDVWRVTISDRKVPRSLSGKRTVCWNGCKVEETGEVNVTMPIIMNDESHDYCAICCTAWVISRSVEGEV